MLYYNPTHIQKLKWQKKLLSLLIAVKNLSIISKNGEQLENVNNN